MHLWKMGYNRGFLRRLQSLTKFPSWFDAYYSRVRNKLELVSKELNHLAAILQDYAGSFIHFFIGKVNPILNDIYFVYG